MLWYQLRLAVGSLRTDSGLSVAMFVCLALGSGLWTAAASHYLRDFPLDDGIASDAHQIEIGHPRALALDRAAGADDFAWHARSWVTFPEYQVLAGSGIPTRQAGSFRAQVLAGRADGSEPGLANARFADADFFDLFGFHVARGRPFTRQEEADVAAVIVLGRVLNQRLFGGRAAVGQTVMIEGRRFNVVGIVDDDEPAHPRWDPAAGGRDQDALFLPLSWAGPLLAWPDQMAVQSPLAAPGDLWTSDAVFVSFWAELPGAEPRARYRQYVHERLTARGIDARVRDLTEWRRAFPNPPSDISYYAILLSAALIGAAFTTARLLLIKGLARRSELGIHRALGATQGSLFLRQMLEGSLIAVPAIGAGLLCAAAQDAFFNHVALATDIPLRLTLAGAVAGAVPSLLIALAAAAYPAWRTSRTPPTLEGERI